MALNFSNLLQGTFFDVCAVAFRIVEQINQFAALFQVKPTCLA
jgi:hypothetical protein